LGSPPAQFQHQFRQVHGHEHQADIIVNGLFASHMNPAHTKMTLHATENRFYVNLSLRVDPFPLFAFQVFFYLLLEVLPVVVDRGCSQLALRGPRQLV